jgi:hypothetical protein
MSARAGLISRARDAERKLTELPEARGVLPPELLAGSAGTPLEWARRFHHLFFDVVESAIDDRGVLVLPHVVVGRPSPLLREIQLWGGTCEAEDLSRMSAVEVGEQFSAASALAASISTGRELLSLMLEWSPDIGDADLQRLMTVSLMLNMSWTLAWLAPYARIGEGVVKAYRPASTLHLLAQERARGKSV